MSMDDHLRRQLEELARTVAESEKASKRALGFVETIRYKDIAFNVSRRFVIADLTPLAFFHLVQHIDAEGPEVAVGRLYERLMPLLTCEHRWTPLKRGTDDHVRNLGNESLAAGSRLHICKWCTAYALEAPGTPLPVLGRSGRKS
jgi:hypothetical protein